MTRKRYMFMAGAILASLPSLAHGASTPSVTAIDFAFRGSDGSQPAALTISAGQSVSFSQGGAAPHNVHFDGTLLPKSCADNGANPPILGPTAASATAPGNGNAQASAWTGSCTFTQVGTYSFHCTVHRFTGTITVDEPPSAAYAPSTFRAVVGQTVSFDAGASSDPDGSITSYRWVWGDGTPDGTGPMPTHVFMRTGLRSVGLYLTDSGGQTAAVGHGITVGDEPPSAAYTPSSYSPPIGQTVSFTASASDPDGSIVSYRWVWGDGTPDGTGPTPTHVFTTTGLRSVALSVTDGDGQTAAVGHGISPVDDVPSVAYRPSTYTPTVGQTVTFTGTASDPDGSIVSYRWVWGDGTPDGSGAVATHAFSTAGLRSVGLYVTDSGGRSFAVGHGINVSGGV